MKTSAGKKLIVSRAVPFALIVCLPPAGLMAAGKDISPYLAFPPVPVITDHAPFSFLVFILIFVFILVSVLPFILKAVQYTSRLSGLNIKKSRALPWWGKLALVSLIVFWVLAWTRFDWFSCFQPHTFFPLWISLIFLINALTVKRIGSCPITASPGRFFILFPVSAIFWWTFEYLNRFVSDWYYTGSLYPALTYFLLASLSFSTVLPAVESMRYFLLSFDLINQGFRHFPKMPRITGRTSGCLLMGLGCMSLALIGFFPDPLFFTVWIAPLFIITGHAFICRLPHPFGTLAQGNLTCVAACALAALCCGIFWEMFNFYSLARWTYTIPYVQTVHIFEMPVLGYAGYLPFGLECGVIVHLLNYDNQ
ncbi:MAG: hypothetical protein U9P10_12430 [Thermodesulfobacteriota bacterium]|nr:hypothetical protein [Thermodesulfobacteriota bacterium]